MRKKVRRKRTRRRTTTEEKNEKHVVRLRRVITLEKQKSRKGHLAPSNLTFLLFAIDRNGFRRMKKEGLIYKSLHEIF